ncbi:MAG: SDR family NAD(P)-dependent oxidoreductase [Pseudomonadota bacterium]|nr:SDR family NAD(P)-dependent oxidoreductase [Pseudomonadota bacterium]
MRAAVVWITGASSGIGEALALQAAQAGAKLVLSARRSEELERVRAACPDPARVALLPFDLAAFDADAMHQAAVRPFGPIDILVNNGGIGQRSLLTETSMDTYRRLFEVNVFAVIALTRAVVPAMQARGRGQVVTISSITGKVGVPFRTGYAAAKHALQGFMDAARAELARDGVAFTTACPGRVRSAFSLNALRGNGARHGLLDRGQARGMPADECARRIWQAVELGRAEIWIGREAWAAWLQRFAPALLRLALTRLPLARFQDSPSNSSR